MMINFLQRICAADTPTTTMASSRNVMSNSQTDVAQDGEKEESVRALETVLALAALLGNPIPSKLKGNHSSSNSSGSTGGDLMRDVDMDIEVERPLGETPIPGRAPVGMAIGVRARASLTGTTISCGYFSTSL